MLSCKMFLGTRTSIGSIWTPLFRFEMKFGIIIVVDSCCLLGAARNRVVREKCVFFFFNSLKEALPPL